MSYANNDQSSNQFQQKLLLTMILNLYQKRIQLSQFTNAHANINLYVTKMSTSIQRKPWFLQAKFSLNKCTINRFDVL